MWVDIAAGRLPTPRWAEITRSMGDIARYLSHDAFRYFRQSFRSGMLAAGVDYGCSMTRRHFGILFSPPCKKNPCLTYATTASAGTYSDDRSTIDFLSTSVDSKAQHKPPATCSWPRQALIGSRAGALII